MRDVELNMYVTEELMCGGLGDGRMDEQATRGRATDSTGGGCREK